MVVVGEDPSWLWACEQMGLLPVLWLGASAASESATRQFFPELRYGGSDPACLSEGIGQKVRAVMVSGSLSGDHLWALQLPGVEWIFSAGKPIRGRMFLKYWQQMESLKLGHSERGGVTDGHYQLQAFRRRGEEARADARQDIKLPTRKPRDLLTVVYDCVETGKDWIKPVTPHVQKPTVRPVSGMRDVFQGGGLLPVRSSRFTRFIVPGVRSRTGWVIRPLTGVEQLQARDVPTRIAEAMNKESDTRAQCWEQLTPAKCLVDGASFILQKHNCATWLTGALVQGVDIPFVAPVVPVTEAEDPKVENGTPGRSHLGLGPQLQREEAEEVDQEARNLKAVKADDAEVPVELWNARIQGRLHPGASKAAVDRALSLLRARCLRWWTRKVTLSYLAWRKGRPHDSKSEVVRNDEAALDGISRAADSSWWQWDAGSRCFFWRWPEDYMIPIRDGVEPWIFGELPKYTRAQRGEKNPQQRARMVEKLSTVLRRGYISPGRIASLTSFFGVPKGTEDIRMVYDGTASGLNDSMWAPNFPLPTVAHQLRALAPGSWMGDLDVSDMFLNFMLHESIREVCGVDLTLFQESTETERLEVRWERWVRSAMGLKSSPYNAVQAMLILEEQIFGDRADPANPFRWDFVRLNLPGSPGYDPSLAWVAKIRREDGAVAGDVFIYVDDLRVTGPDRVTCEQGMRRAACVMNTHGVQDASRKRREASQGENGAAWAGSIASVTDENVYVRVSQEKWDKMKLYLRETVADLEGSDQLVRKSLETRRGFLNYVTRTYPEMTPYLKGFHLTIDGWRPDRDGEGWKKRKRRPNPTVFSEEGLKAQGEYESELIEADPAEAPKMVDPAPRLAGDLKALIELTSGSEPPMRRVRCREMIGVFYGFGDASRDGFGTTFRHQSGNTEFRFGQWCTEESERSSNYRELKNLVELIEERVATGELRGCEMFLFTDNSTAESVYCKGNSSSRLLFDLVLRLRKLAFEGDLLLHVVHVAGTRMIAEGTDGISRGDAGEGAMLGQDMLDFVPLHLSAVDRSPKLVDWCKSWWDEERGPLHHQTPEDWFANHTEGNFLWTPAPAAAEAVVEQLGKAQHKRPHACHIVIVPRLLTGRWRKDLMKRADLVLTVPCGVSVWDANQHEPLLMFICLPLSSHAPWRLRRTPYLESFGRIMRAVFDDTPERSGSVLRKFLSRTRSLESLSSGLVRGVLRGSYDESVLSKAARG